MEKDMLNMLHKITLFLHFWSVLNIVSAETLNCKDSGASSFVIKDVRLSTCTNKSCVLYHGREYDLEVEAVATSSTEFMPFKVSGKKYTFNIPLIEGNFCDGLQGGKCPVSTGDQLLYKDTIKIPTGIPNIKGNIIATVYDSNEEKILMRCSVDVELRSPPDSSIFKSFPFFKIFRKPESK